jgi:hypothetical protein
MRDAIVTTILSAAAVALLGWVVAKFSSTLDRRKVHLWLSSNTKDEPGESHVDTARLAKGTRLPEDRVRRACMSDRRIYHLAQEPEQWSVWRKEPQSIYDKRDLLVV